MPKRSFAVLVATDGSPPGPGGGRGDGEVPVAGGRAGLRGRGPAPSRMPGWRRSVRAALTRSLRREARRAQRALRRRWTDAQVAVVDAPPATAILVKARKRGTRSIVLGSRNVGGLRRLVLGSVSRAVVRRAPCTVLVGRAAPARCERVRSASTARPGRGGRWGSSAAFSRPPAGGRRCSPSSNPCAPRRSTVCPPPSVRSWATSWPRSRPDVAGRPGARSRPRHADWRDRVGRWGPRSGAASR